MDYSLSKYDRSLTREVRAHKDTIRNHQKDMAQVLGAWKDERRQVQHEWQEERRSFLEALWFDRQIIMICLVVITGLAFCLGLHKGENTFLRRLNTPMPSTSEPFVEVSKPATAPPTAPVSGHRLNDSSSSQGITTILTTLCGWLLAPITMILRELFLAFTAIWGGWAWLFTALMMIDLVNGAPAEIPLGTLVFSWSGLGASFYTTSALEFSWFWQVITVGTACLWLFVACKKGIC